MWCIRREASDAATSLALARRSAMVTLDRLREVVSYDASTGIFVWKISPRFSVPAGSVITPSKSHKYVHIGIDGKAYKAHRLAWLYTNGVWPDEIIDHINGDTTDNRISNLRDCSKAINAQNQRVPHKRNTTGYLGVTKTGSLKRPYRAQINTGGHIAYIGIFETPQMAHEAYLSRKREIHPGCVI